MFKRKQIREEFMAKNEFNLFENKFQYKNSLITIKKNNIR